MFVFLGHLQIPVGSTNLHVEDVESVKVDSDSGQKDSEDTSDGASQSAVILHVKKSNHELSTNDKNANTAPLIQDHQVLGFRMTCFHWAYIVLICVHLVWMVLGTIWTIPIFIR